MLQRHRGFTLIELMIVIAIIGILAAIAMPIYQNYITRSQLSRAVYEINSTRTAIETILGSGNFPTLDPAQDGQDVNGKKQEYIALNFNPQSTLLLSATIDNASTNTFNYIQAVMGKNTNPALNGVTITYHRDVQGNWNCVITPVATLNIRPQIGNCSYQ